MNSSSLVVPPINPSKALYIKLGEGGLWESNCILRHQTLQLGYREASHNFCVEGNWDAVLAELKTVCKDAGAATRHTNQIRLFYESDETVLWITFFADRLYWCFSERNVTQLENKTKTRPVIGQWRSTDVAGKPLQKNQLSGKLLSSEGFRGTICSVRESSYLVERINGRVLKDVADAREALSVLEQRLVTLIRRLHPKDFEILVDLIFRQAGWQRVSVLGETQKLIDLDLLSPVTSERYAVQVKSKANRAEFESYKQKFADMQGYTRCYFVVHTPSTDLVEAKAPTDTIKLLQPKDVARLAAKYGLADWVIDKAS